MFRKTTKAWLIATALAATATAMLAATIAAADPDSRHKDVAGKASGHIEAYGPAPPGQEASGRYAGRLTVP